ncbi:MAG: hypothetical protein H6512_11525 [Acidimicrobiia bacterium]|nr:hypothetical protein [Acidimicrobiia bacterium]
MTGSLRVTSSGCVTYQAVKTEATTLEPGETDLTWDQGIVPPVPPASIGDKVFRY